MENSFAVKVHNFFLSQNEKTRSGILEYYSLDPPDGMYLFWNVSQDDRLQDIGKEASIILDNFFLSEKNNYVSFELAHRQAAKLFKRYYQNSNVFAEQKTKQTISRSLQYSSGRKTAPVRNQQCTVSDDGAAT